MSGSWRATLDECTVAAHRVGWVGANGYTATCEWFALCDHPASEYVSHPILGDVPACQCCAAWVITRHAGEPADDVPAELRSR